MTRQTTSNGHLEIGHGVRSRACLRRTLQKRNLHPSMLWIYFKVKKNEIGNGTVRSTDENLGYFERSRYNHSTYSSRTLREKWTTALCAGFLSLQEFSFSITANLINQNTYIIDTYSGFLPQDLRYFSFFFKCLRK